MLRNKYYFLASDPEWTLPDIARLASRWLVADLRRQGPVPAATGRAAAGDVLAALAWLAAQAPRMVHRRRQHALLHR
jgi:hypothetical protein